MADIEYRKGGEVSDDERAAILAEYAKKHATTTDKEFCKANRIQVHTLNYWKRQEGGGTPRASKPTKPAPAAKPKEEDIDDVLKDVGNRLQAALTLAEGQETKLLEQLETVREKIEKTKETMRRMGFEPKAKEPESALDAAGN